MLLLRSLLLSLACVLSAASASAAAALPKLVMLIAEPEYDTGRTLPEFAAKHLAKDFRVVTVTGSTAAGQNTLDPIGELADADVLLVSVRRRTPPVAQLEAIRRHIAAGKPVVGIRTASHAFALGKGQKLPDGAAEWAQFDAEVLGGNYQNHHAKGSGASTIAAATPAAASHPILRDLMLPFSSESTLYKNTPLRAGATPLLTGTIANQPTEPIAWTFTRADGGRSFYTSLGGPSDFANPAFVQLLRNGLRWAATGK